MKKVLLILAIIFSISIVNAKTNEKFYVGYAEGDISPQFEKYTEEEKKLDSMPNIPNCDENNRTKTKATNPLPLGATDSGSLKRAVDGQCIDKDNHIKTTVVAVKDENNNYMIFISADLLGFFRDVENGSGTGVAKMREDLINYIKTDEELHALNIKPKIEYGNIMFSASHTHSAPIYTYHSEKTNEEKKLKVSVVSYDVFLRRRIFETVKEALKDMQEADISYDKFKIFLDSNGNVTNANYKGEKKYLNFVRHYYIDNYFYENGQKVVKGVSRGYFGIYCPNNKYNEECEKKYTSTSESGISRTREADHDMQVIKISFSDKTKKTVLMVNWQAHPTLETVESSASNEPRTINADYVGYLRNYLASKGYRISFFQGAAGDINATSYLQNDSLFINGKSITYEYGIKTPYDGKFSAKTVGERLGEIAYKRINDSNFFKKDKFDSTNGIKYYRDGSKSLYNSSIVDNARTSWNDKDSKGNYIYTIDTYTNAYFINSLYEAAYNYYKDKNDDTILKMINGTYPTTEWKNGWSYVDQSGKTISFRFPKFFQIIDDNGKVQNRRKEVSEKLKKILYEYQHFWPNLFTFEVDSKGNINSVSFKKFDDIGKFHTITMLLGPMLDNLETKAVDESIKSRSHASRILALYADTSSQKNKNPYKLELYAFSIGNIGFATAPYEMFSSSGEYIKQNSKYPMTFILGYTNDKTVGYIPDEESINYQCYEDDNRRTAAGRAEKNADDLVKKLNSMYNSTSTQPSPTTGTSAIKGDVDGNSVVNIFDYIAIRKHLLKLKILTGDKLKNADVNADGKVSNLDYKRIREIIESKIRNKN